METCDKYNKLYGGSLIMTVDNQYISPDKLLCGAHALSPVPNSLSGYRALCGLYDGLIPRALISGPNALPSLGDVLEYSFAYAALHNTRCRGVLAHIYSLTFYQKIHLFPKMGFVFYYILIVPLTYLIWFQCLPYCLFSYNTSFSKDSILRVNTQYDKEFVKANKA